jgi:hypothetical protein
MARRILLAFALLVAAGVVGVVVLWLMDALGAARRMSFDPIAYSLFQYFVIIGVTLCVYWFARSVVVINPFDNSELWRTWCYLRWVFFAGVLSWGFVGLMSKGIWESANALPDISAIQRARLDRADIFLKGYLALLVAGFAGTFAGIKETVAKRPMR